MELIILYANFKVSKINQTKQNLSLWTPKMVQPVTDLATKPDNQSLILGTHMAK